MTQELYDIYFTGQLVEGTTTETAIANMAKLFKKPAEDIAKLFNGKPQLLKRGADKTAALKYKAALHQAGILVAFRAHQDSVNADPIAQSAPSTAATSPADQAKDNQDWSLAPAGSDLLKENERYHPTPLTVDTSAIKMVSSFMEIPAEIKIAPPAPNTNHLSIAATGEDLLIDKPVAIAAPNIDIEDITLAPAGAEIDHIQHNLPPLQPNIDGITIAEPGADILEGIIKAPVPPAPNTDHLALDDD